MKKIIILTGDETRHCFFKKFIALQDNISVLKTYCESKKNSIHDVVSKRDNSDPVEGEHLLRRAAAEDDFFGAFVDYAPDKSNSQKIDRNEVSSHDTYNEIKSLNPDLIVAYGCSLLKGPLLSTYKNKILNVHLGISPYYRGSGTNFWAQVNNELEYMGATFMFLDAGVDTGEIIHQIRPRVYIGDGPNQIGNRLIKDMAETYAEIIQKFDHLEPVQTLDPSLERHYYKRADYNSDAVKALYMNYANGMIENYIRLKDEKEKSINIVHNKAIKASS